MSAAERPRVPFLPSLEGMRGIAALSVVVYHCWVLSGQGRLGIDLVRDTVSAGFLGVDVFFVLSGFVLFLPVALTGSLGPTGAFWLRRAARLLPAYWVVLVVVVAAAPLLVGNVGFIRDNVNLASAAAHAVLMPGLARLVPGYDGAVGFNGAPVVWTLTVEALFALALPFVAGACLRRPVLLLGGAIAGGLALRWWIGSNPLAITETTENKLFSLLPPLLTDFGLGMAAVLVWVRLERAGRAERYAWLAFPALAAMFVAAVLVGGADAKDVRDQIARSVPVMAVVPFAVAVLCVALAAGEGRPLERLLSTRPVRASGRWSYGVYLVHFPVILFAVVTLDLPHDGTTVAWLVMCAFAVPVSLALGAASFRYVEEPARRWAKRRRPRPAAAVRVAAEP